MAITILSQPLDIAPVYNPMYIFVKSTKTAEEAFNFTFDLYVNGNFVSRDRLTPRPNTIQAIFSPARVLESYVSYDLTQNLTGTTGSTNCVDQYKVVCGEEYINPWRFYNNRAISGGTYYNYTELYTTGTTNPNPYVSGSTIYVVQDAGFYSNIYNGTFNVLSANSTSIIIDLLHTVNTPINGGLVYYSDKRKTSYSGNTNILYNPLLLFPQGGWSSFGPDGCSVTLGLTVSNLLTFSIPDVSCASNDKTIYNTGTTVYSGISYQITTTVSNVNNPSGNQQYVQAIVGGTSGPTHSGVGTWTDTIVAAADGQAGLRFYMDADTGGFGSHSMSVSAYSVTTESSVSGYCWNGVVQYEEVPTWTYNPYLMISGNTGKFLTNQPSSVLTKLTDRGSIGWMNMAPYSGAAYSMFVVSTRFDKSPTIPVPFPISMMTGTTTNNRIIEFGCYPWNLNQASQALYGVDVIDDGIESYQILILCELDPIGDPYNFIQVSEAKTFEIDTTCSKYEPVRFMWLNESGQFDYYSATLLSRETVNISRTTYTKSLAYNYQVGDRGKTVISTDAQQSYIVNSNWVDEETLAWLGEMFWSQEVYVINDDGSLMPVIVDNTAYEPKKRVNEQLFNQTFTYTKAVMKNTQRN